MHLLKFDTAEKLDAAGADFVADLLQNNSNALICAATGSSPTGMYKKLVEKQSLHPADLKFIKLDEWAGLPMTDQGSCEYYLQQNLLKPLGIPQQNYISFNSEADVPAEECKRIGQYLAQNGPIDLCILGLGLNGHIAFIDPADALQPGVHLSKLSATSLAHPMVKDAAVNLKYGYTLGLADILQSKTILLIVNGRHKETIFQEFLKAEISTKLPASFLWLHANVYCFYCLN